MDRKGFLTDIWNYRLKPVANILALVIVGLLLLSISSVDFGGGLVSILETMIKLIAYLFTQYWYWILLLIVSIVFIKILYNKIPSKYKPAFNRATRWLGILGTLALLAWFNYRFYVKKEYFSMMLFSCWLLFLFGKEYFKRKNLKETSE